MACEEGKIIPSVNGTVVEDESEVKDIEDEVKKFIAACGAAKGIYGIDVDTEGSFLFVSFVYSFVVYIHNNKMERFSN